MLENCRFCHVFIDYLLGVHDAKVSTSSPTDDISQTGVSINQRRFHLDRGLLIHSMAVNDVGHFKAAQVNLMNTLQLLFNFVAFNLRPHMSEYAVLDASSYVKSFAIS